MTNPSESPHDSGDWMEDVSNTAVPTQACEDVRQNCEAGIAGGFFSCATDLCPIKLPLSAVSRRGGLAKGCSFYMVPSPGLQAGPFRRYGAKRYEARAPLLFGATEIFPICIETKQRCRTISFNSDYLGTQQLDQYTSLE